MVPEKSHSVLPTNMKLCKTGPLASHSIDHRILAAGTFNDCQVPYFPGYILMTQRGNGVKWGGGN